MKNLFILNYLLALTFILATAAACQRSGGDDDGEDTETGVPSTSDGDSDSDGDGDGDTDLSGWTYDGPRQTEIGTVTVTCDAANLVTADCGPAAPSPCVPSGKIICDMVIADSEGVEQYSGVVGIEQWGRGTGLYDKPNYEFEMRLADGVTENPAVVLGMGREEDWILDGSWTDRTLMRQDILFDIFKTLGGKTHAAADSRYVTLTFNGESRGIYRVMERIKRDDDRVNIPVDPGDFGQNFIVKLDDDGSIKNIEIGAVEEDWMCVYPSENKVTEAQRTGIRVWIAQLREAMLAGTPFDMLNQTNVVDWVLMNEFAKNIRTFEKGWFLFKKDNDKGNLVPFDADMSFGQPDTSAEGWVPHNNMTNYLLADSTFKPALVSRWAELRAGPLAEDALTQRIDDYLLALPDAATDANFTMWPMANLDLGVIDETYAPPTATDFAGEVAALRQWISDRLAWIDSNIESYQ